MQQLAELLDLKEREFTLLKRFKEILRWKNGKTLFPYL